MKYNMLSIQRQAWLDRVDMEVLDLLEKGYCKNTNIFEHDLFRKFRKLHEFTEISLYERTILKISLNEPGKTAIYENYM